jgi:RNA polymerase sigma-70 factor (ECF subfamily)
MPGISPVKRNELKALPDERIIAAARDGERRAFAELVRRYEETVYRFAYSLCREREKAEETFQDTFISVFRKLRTFDGRSKFSTWLYTIVTNSCLMRHRRRKMRGLEDSLEALDTPPAGADGRFAAAVPRWEKTPADVMMDKELRAQLDAAIRKLPDDYRLVFTLRDIEGKSTAEAAAIAGISEEAAKSRLRRARAFLRQQLTPYMTARDGGGA